MNFEIIKMQIFTNLKLYLYLQFTDVEGQSEMKGVLEGNIKWIPHKLPTSQQARGLGYHLVWTYN